MSFLDNLENNLKALEAREEKDPAAAAREKAAREAAKAESARKAPFVEALRKGAFTDQFLAACRAVGFGKRILVQFTWIDDVLRLDAKNKRLELRPTAEGILAVQLVDGQPVSQQTVDLAKADPQQMAATWLA